MLIKATGNCEKCRRHFNDTGELIMEQSVNLTCANNKCGTKVRYCRDCKELGCPICGGRLLDQFELNPGLMF
jgi:hypothetical protein